MVTSVLLAGLVVVSLLVGFSFGAFTSLSVVVGATLAVRTVAGAAGFEATLGAGLTTGRTFGLFSFVVGTATFALGSTGAVTLGSVVLLAAGLRRQEKHMGHGYTAAGRCSFNIQSKDHLSRLRSRTWGDTE